MTDNRKLIEEIIDVIEDLDLETLHKCPKLELLLPKLYESLIVDDECIHSFNDKGVCICGAVKNTK